MKREEIAPGVCCTACTDAKFRSCLLELNFLIPAEKRTAELSPCYALLCDLLTASTKRCPSRADLTEQLDALYAADLTAHLTSCGDALMLTVSAEWLDDSFSPDGTAVTAEMLALVYDCLHDPNAENGAFDAEEFRLCMQNLLDDIDCEQNDKRSFLLQKAAELAYAGEPAALPPCGTRAAADQITPQAAYAVWRDMMLHTAVDAVCVSPRELPAAGEMLTRLFAERKTAVPFPQLAAPGRKKPAPQFYTEDTDAVQSKLCAVYQYDSIPQDTARLLNAVLGTAPNALLFRDLREKLGLCYYCTSSVSLLKSSLTVDLGVRTDQIEAAQRGIEAEIAAIRRGDFPDALLEEAKRWLAYQDAVGADSTGGIAAACMRHTLYGDDRTAAARRDAVQQITREMLTDAAKQLRLGTVCVLRGTLREGAVS